MPKIRITPETLEQQSSQLISMKGEHEQIYAKIRKLVQDLAAEWEGAAQQSFVQTFEARDAQFRKFAEDVQDFGWKMKLAAQALRDTDTQLKAQMSK
ncbi:hypothetical protein AGMMS50276_09310 [Synergistales bacterium]|nr:hypothetical protein AGMMS50276_09310 [Synergistales bacterium]